MTAVLAALSVSDEIEKYGAYAGIAAVVGLGVLALLYFAQAREVKRLREWAGRAPERDADLQQRVVAAAQVRSTPAKPLIARPAQPGAAVTPAGAAGTPAPVPAAAAATAAALAARNPGGRGGSTATPGTPAATPAAATAAGAGGPAAQPGAPVARPPGGPAATPGTLPAGAPAPGAKPAPGTPSAPGGPGPGAPATPGSPAVTPGQPAATPGSPGTPSRPAATPGSPATPGQPAARPGAPAPVPGTPPAPKPAAPAAPAAPAVAAGAAAGAAAAASAAPPSPVTPPTAAAPAAAAPPTTAQPAATPQPPPPSTPAAGATPAAPRPASAAPAPAAPRPAAAAPLRTSTPEATLPPRGREADGAARGRRSILAIVLGGLALVAVAVLLVTQIGGDSDDGAGARPNTIGETTPAAEDDDSGSSTAQPIDRAGTTISVLNGTTVTGLARGAMNRILERGYREGIVVTNTDQTIEKTVVQYARGSRRQALDVARIVGVGRSALQPIDQNTRVLGGADASVVVIVGADRAQ